VKKLAIMMAAGLMVTQVFGAAFQSKVVSESAKWVVHADVDLIKQTELGGLMLNQLKTGQTATKLAALTAVLRFDPLTDLADITLYGKSKTPAEAVALFGGTFDEQHLTTLLKANASYEASLHGKHTIHSWIDEAKPRQGRQYGCIPSSGKLLISQGLPMLQEALNVLDGTLPSLDVMKTFGAALPVKDPFFVAGSDLPGLGGQPQAQMLSQAKSGRIAMGEKDGQMTLSIALITTDEAAAQKLRDVAQGLLAIGQMNQDQDPKLTALLQAIRITLEGGKVQLDASYPSAQLFSMIQDKMNKKTAPATAPAPATP
jgi:hypothetical protein